MKGRRTIKKILTLAAALCLLACAAAAADGDYLADYDEAFRLLEEFDPFLPLVKRQTPAFEQMREEGRRKAAGQCESPETLYFILSDLFARMGNPGHLSMVSPEGYQDCARLAEQGVLEADGPEISLITDEKTRAAYAAMGRAPQRGEDPAGAYPPYARWDPERRLLCLRFQSFRHDLLARDRDAVARAVGAHPDAEHIVFDIRGNGGGSDAYWMEALAAPFGEAASYETRLFFRDDALTRAYGYMDGAAPVSALAQTPAFVSELGLTHARTEAFSIAPAAGESRLVHTDARRWVLTDEQVYSAADGFASFCKQTHWAALVGRPTKGDGGGIPPVLMRLPRTGLLLRFTAAASANGDGTLNAFTGTAPDFPAKPRESAYDALLRILDGAKAR